ncbi:tRNA 4-thiouridine(8) synthase ThiI [Desulfothermobacter acidiphilus]|uniref:tRNA 4-thiouridine(8) synthase ThiI n=1 Tax=Desulfothermobacter acidiphilus TaxID=1938353 RepID=UPI003F8BAA3C
MKALALFSGGLDSILAVKLIELQGIKVVGVAFTSPFFDASRAVEMAEKLGLSLRVVDITEELIPLVLNPRHGYGKHFNPCIDCHALMLRKAGELMKEEGASFIITGEVLGERPMSQNRQALEIVAREAGLEGYVLRPLSALLLPPTIPEKEGWVKREKLLGIKGRSRKPQLELARRLGIEEFPTPAGGCLLTDPGYARRIKELLRLRSAPSRQDFELLKYGRHFFLPGVQIVVARKEEENARLLALQEPADFLLRLKDIPGPRTLVRGNPEEKDLRLAAALTIRYSKAREKERARVVAERKEPPFTGEIELGRAEVEELLAEAGAPLPS